MTASAVVLGVAGVARWMAPAPASAPLVAALLVAIVGAAALAVAAIVALRQARAIEVDALTRSLQGDYFTPPAPWP